MKNCISESKTKLDRKTVERNRRIHMKGLCFKLVSLIPSHHYKTSKEMMSQQDQLDEAANYITQLKNRIDELQKKKEQALEAKGLNSNNNRSLGVKLPIVEVKELDSSISVSVISGVDKTSFMLYQLIGILQEEGAEVVTATVSTIGDNIFHTLHAHVKISRVGIEMPRLTQRLREIIYST